jgi:hypothetical protein
MEAIDKPLNSLRRDARMIIIRVIPGMTDMPQFSAMT